MRLLSWILPLLLVGQALATAQDLPVLEEIVVTATKREVNLQDLTLSVRVLSSEFLDEAGVQRLEDYWRNIPSLAVQDGPFGGKNVIIRGLVDTDSFQQNEAISAIYLDDTHITHVAGLFSTPGEPTLVDIERIEALRGPQGTMLGGNAMGGALRLITQQPDPGERTLHLDSSVSATEGGGTNYTLNPTVNLPLPDGESALRITAWHNNYDGYIDDIGTGRDDINDDETSGARGSLLYSLNDKLELLARLQYEDRTHGGFNYADPVGKPELGLETGDYEVALLTPEHRDEDMTIASLQLNWQAEWADFTSVTSWYKREIDGRLDWSPEFKHDFFGFYYPAVGNTEQDQEDFTQEFRISSRGESSIEWLAGAFYLDQDTESIGELVAPGIHDFCPGCFPFIRENGEMLHEDRKNKREDLALFGEISFPLTDTLEATLGLRWYSTDSERNIQGFFMFAPDLGESVDGDSDGFAYKYALAWTPRPELMLYALASSGFRPGQFNDAPARQFCGAEPILDSDELWNYELGARSQWFERRLMVNVTAFSIDWSDMQTSALIPGCPFVILDNIGEASSKGVELEYTAVVNQWLALDGSLGYNQAELDEDNPAFNAESGTPLPNVPEWTASIAAHISYPLGDSFSGYTRIEAQYVDSRPTRFDSAAAIANGGPDQLDSYSLVNLRSGIERGHWRAELFANNLLDEEADLFCCRLWTETTVNRPRTVGLRVVLSH